MSEQNQRTAFPSHGRGRRFNPYSAHHFAGTSRQYPAVSCRTIPQHARSIGAKSVQSVHGAYGPSNELTAILKNELLMRGDQLRDAPHENGCVVECNLHRANNAKHVWLNSC